VQILNRYIFKESLVFFAISLFAFTGILLTLRMIHFASLIVNRGVEVSQIMGVFISIIPTFLEIAIPMATLLGVMMALARLSGDSEIIVMRASGISIFQLVKPIIAFGIVSALTSLVVSMILKPWGYQNLSKVLFEIARSKSTSGLTEGIFNPLGSMMLYAEKINFSNGDLSRILIDDRRDQAERKLIIAKSGKILSDAEEQTITLLLSDGEIHEVVQNRYVITKFNDNNLVMSADELLDADVQTKGRSAKEMSISELHQGIGNYEETAATEITPPDIELQKKAAEAKKRFRRMRTEYGNRFAMPFASFILALVALPLGILPPRAQKTWGAGLSVMLGLLVFVCYYGLLSMGVTLGENGALNAYVGLWIPNLVSSIVALFLIQKIGSEKWSSVAERFTITFTIIGKKLRGFKRDAVA